jgi:hypothetical protein
MSYIMTTGPGRDSGRRRRRMLFSAVAIMVVALLVAAFLMGRQHTRPTAEQGFAPPQVTGPAIAWARLGPQPVPVSPTHGPADTGHGLAAGFSRDELGAVLAAINISVRLTGRAGPPVYETTARLQCVGDINAAIGAIRGQRSTAAAGSTTPSEYFYRITSGDPSGDLVVVSIAATTPQSRSLGGYTELTRTLQWIDGDWKLHVPPAPPRLITSIRGWTSLGMVPDA